MFAVLKTKEDPLSCVRRKKRLAFCATGNAQGPILHDQEINELQLPAPMHNRLPIPCEVQSRRRPSKFQPLITAQDPSTRSIWQLPAQAQRWDMNTLQQSDTGSSEDYAAAARKLCTNRTGDHSVHQQSTAACDMRMPHIRVCGDSATPQVREAGGHAERQSQVWMRHEIHSQSRRQTHCTKNLKKFPDIQPNRAQRKGHSRRNQNFTRPESVYMPPLRRQNRQHSGATNSQ